MEMKNVVDGLNSRTHTTQERISKLEAFSIEIYSEIFHVHGLEDSVFQ